MKVQKDQILELPHFFNLLKMKCLTIEIFYMSWLQD